MCEVRKRLRAAANRGPSTQHPAPSIEHLHLSRARRLEAARGGDGTRKGACVRRGRWMRTDSAAHLETDEDPSESSLACDAVPGTCTDKI